MRYIIPVVHLTFKMERDPNTLNDPADATKEEIEQKKRHENEVLLTMMGDMPSESARPQESVLFVAKLSPITDNESLKAIFERRLAQPGCIKRVDIKRDRATGDSLCYGFVEFNSSEMTDKAYTVLQGIEIDDRRLVIDFSQSVSRSKPRGRPAPPPVVHRAEHQPLDAPPPPPPMSGPGEKIKKHVRRRVKRSDARKYKKPNEP